MPTPTEISHQRQLLATHPQTLAYLLQQQAQFTTAHTPPHIRTGIDEACAGITKCKAALRGWGVEVADHPDDGDALVPTTPTTTTTTPPPTSSPTQPIDRIKLRDLINATFSDAKIQDLCFDLGIDYENLPGSGKSAKARELVSYMERRSRLAELAQKVQQLRPGM
ncbi:MAG: hypothetical protein Fur005_33830 [Roseiflexaceae bacterium]